MKTRDEIEGQLSEAASEAYEWKKLLEFPAFQRYLEFLRQQQRAREVTVTYTPISSEHSAWVQEYFKGEAAGIGLAISFPATQLELAEMKRRTLTKEMERYDDAEMDQRTAEAASASRLDGVPFGP